MDSTVPHPDRLACALALIDDAHREDPNHEVVDGVAYPREYLYALRMTAWLWRLDPGADEARQLAARAQHIRRWTRPRADYPMTRAGYLRWRAALYAFHARETTALLERTDYDADTVGRVSAMLQKRGLKRDPDVQLIEDVACLVFLEHYFLAFAAGQDEDRLVDIVRKTWKKMSAPAQAVALTLPFPDAARVLLGRALGGVD